MVKNNPLGLGVYEGNDRAFLFKKSKKNNKILVSFSLNGTEFKKFKSAKITKDNKPQTISNLNNFKITKSKNLYYLVYSSINKNTTSLNLAKSDNLSSWNHVSQLPKNITSALLIPNLNSNNHQFITTKNNNILFNSKKLISSSSKLILANLIELQNEYLIIYYQTKDNYLDIKTMLISKDSSPKLLWKNPKTLWSTDLHLDQKPISPLGVIRINDKFISYWETNDNEIFALDHIPHHKIHNSPDTGFKKPLLNKYSQNPILNPLSEKSWESYAVFNPAAIYDKGKVHLLYRAVGDAGSSVWGYAESVDGFNFKKRECPVYIPTQNFEINDKNYCSLKFFSGGGGHGGCEDPRITKINNKFFVTYVAYDGRSAPKIALTTIKENDFHQKNWSKWTKPIVISKPGEAHKNWVMFPEKIKNKYAILHSITPNLQIKYLESLNFKKQKYIKSHYQLQDVDHQWDTTIRGVGPPPLKTKDGWLVFYHAMSKFDPGKYKIGAMILDSNNPKKILYKSRHPVLEPVKHYETSGIKGNVVFSCGSVIINNDLFLYYGASDNTVNVAYENLPEFLDNLKYHGAQQMKILH